MTVTRWGSSPWGREACAHGGWGAHVCAHGGGEACAHMEGQGRSVCTQGGGRKACAHSGGGTCLCTLGRGGLCTRGGHVCAHLGGGEACAHSGGGGGRYALRVGGGLCTLERQRVRLGLPMMEGKDRLAVPAWATLDSASLQGRGSPPPPVACVRRTRNHGAHRGLVGEPR